MYIYTYIHIKQNKTKTDINKTLYNICTLLSPCNCKIYICDKEILCKAYQPAP